MGSIMNGIAVHGGTRPYGGTFLVFSDYMRGAVRLSALMKLPVTYVWTHDSIGVGEDGPTHQPIEHVAALRAIPGLDVVRPADGNETAAAWATILEHNDRPAGLILTRQNLPTFPRGADGFADISGVAKGGYVLKDSRDHPRRDPDRHRLRGAARGRRRRAAGRRRRRRAGRVHALPGVVRRAGPGVPGLGLPPSVTARVSVEAGVSQGWREIVGDAGRIVSLNHYGASAAAGLLFTEFGFTPETVAAAAQESLAAATESTAATTTTVKQAASGPVGPADAEEAPEPTADPSPPLPTSAGGRSQASTKRIEERR